MTLNKLSFPETTKKTEKGYLFYVCTHICKNKRENSGFKLNIWSYFFRDFTMYTKISKVLF